MRVSINMPTRVYDYFKEYDFNDLVDCLLQQYDITAMPQTTVDRNDRVERVVNVTDPTYIQLYNIVGPRSKKVSLARLLEFAYNMDVLSNPHFEVKPTSNKDNPTASLIGTAYRALLNAQRYNPDDKELKEITDLVYALKEVADGAEM